jgi:hypothetical protein
VKWLREAPPEARDLIKIEGFWGSFSSLLLVRMPIHVWDLLPESPAVSFVGFTTTDNRGPELQNVVNTLLAAGDEEHLENRKEVSTKTEPPETAKDRKDTETPLKSPFLGILTDNTTSFKFETPSVFGGGLNDATVERFPSYNTGKERGSSDPLRLNFSRPPRQPTPEARASQQIPLGRYKDGNGGPLVVARTKRAISIGNSSEIREFYTQQFQKIQQNACKLVAKRWVKAIAPKKQSLNPYTGGEEKAPDWWPKPWGSAKDEKVRHVEPDHLLKKGV